MKALITGASSGLGREMARLLAARGYELILCARREERLRELAAELPVPCRVIAADVSDEQECRLLYEAVQSEELEVVINNAGFGLFGEFVTADLDEELRMIDTKRAEIKQLIASLAANNPQIEANIFNAVKNVDTAKLLGWRDANGKHNFLDQLE